ncbi:MFS transporter [Synechococcus sp. BS56D]|nr:MFS transporter [Synechococcus sp. BS56D]TCD59685.1 MFS transporter [Synechococcus sp. BS56D]
MAVIRWIASLGAGGVIYMTPIIFHQVDLSASQVGQGLAASALIGTVARLLSGLMLDRGLSCSWPVRAAAVLALIADLVLLQAHGFEGYVSGQLLIGVAAGFYFPAIELAVPLSTGSFPSSRGYALARSADALGVAMGALTGAVLAGLGLIRGVFLVEAAAVLAMLTLLAWRPLPDGRDALLHPQGTEKPLLKEPAASAGGRWLLPLLPVLALSIVATGMIALMQSALPLDLVRGGLERPALSEAWSGGLIALQLSLLVVLQWPVGNWVARRSLRFGLGLGLVSFAVGCLLLAGSALWSGGVSLIPLAVLPVAFGEAAFLPTAAEAMVEETPLQHRGLAMALFSQCFAISATGAPLIAGTLLDSQGHGLVLWLLMALICVCSTPLLKSVRPRYTAGLAAIPLPLETDEQSPGTAALRAQHDHPSGAGPDGWGAGQRR